MSPYETLCLFSVQYGYVRMTHSKKVEFITFFISLYISLIEFESFSYEFNCSNSTLKIVFDVFKLECSKMAFLGCNRL